MRARLKLIVLFFILLSTLSQNAFSEEPMDTVWQTTKAVGINAALGYLSCASYLLTHELGHALVAKACTGSKIDIHIGARCSKEKPLLKIGGITIEGLNPLQGFARSEHPLNNKAQKVCFYIAGGILGGIQSYIFLSCAAAYHKYQECGDIKESIQYGLKNALFPFKNIGLNKNLTKPDLYAHTILSALGLMMNIRKLLYSLIPSNMGLANIIPSIDNRSDGSNAWKTAGATVTTQKLACVVSWALEWVLRTIIIKQAITCIKTHPSIKE